MFGAGLLNEARSDGRCSMVGRFRRPSSTRRISGSPTVRPSARLAEVVARGTDFGGPATLPTGRKDTLYVFNDTLTYVAGRHSVKTGGEFRRFLNNNFTEGTGQFNFPSMASFLSGTANAFSITLGERRSHITAGRPVVLRPGCDSARPVADH